MKKAYLKDYLLVYAKNHRIPAYAYVPVVGGFMAAKFYMYSYRADPITILMFEALLFLPWMMLFFQRRLYRQILSWRDYPMPDAEAQSLMMRIAFNKALYMLPWLFLLFFPVHAPYLYDHLLGYLFVFFAVSMYASASAVLMPLFIFDVGLLMAFAGYVTWLNRAIQETPYIGGAIGLFCLFMLYLGGKFHQSQVELIQSRAESDRNAKHAQEANTAKSRFLALMSHEIRTPMTGIVGMVEFMKETPLNDEQKSFLGTISECSKTLLNTLNDILDVSKLEAGKLEISNVNCDFHNVLGNCTRLLARIAAEKHIYLKLEIDPAVPKLVYGDPHRIQQVVINLLNNAVKFTVTGGVTLRAGFRGGGTYPVLCVEVQDTGIGISKENIKKLFKSFSQADSSIARKFGGTGLGLSIIKNLLGLMGGKIGVKSEEGKGSVFWFELPYHEPRADEAAAEQEGVPALSKLEILLAEDNKVNQQIALRLLGNKGHMVTVANDGVEAVRLARDNAYDIILMDVNMPLKSGFDATIDIRTTGGRNETTPIIALTATIIDENVKQCMDAGMNGYVAKPFSPHQLYKEMAKFLPGKIMTLTEQQAAETLSPAPAPVSTSTAPPQGATLNENLRAIREELGSAYMTLLVDNSIKEVRRLTELLQEEFEKKDYVTLHRSAHDLKGVSGLIGMGETCHHAEAIEKACANKEYERLPELLAVLKLDGERETHEMEEIRE